MRKLCLLAVLAIGFGGLPPAVNASLWRSVPATEQARTAPAARFAADDAALRERLALAPHEMLLDRSYAVELPMPNGSLRPARCSSRTQAMGTKMPRRPSYLPALRTVS